MAKLILILLLLMTPAFMLTTGCYVSKEKTEVKQPPPAPTSAPIRAAPTSPPLRVEERPAAPSPADVWIPGHWDWNGNDWVWTSGQWVEPPHSNAVWLSGHWDWNGHEYVWIPGHWQQ